MIAFWDIVPYSFVEIDISEATPSSGRGAVSQKVVIFILVAVRT
jgi:hypothetical protein